MIDRTGTVYVENDTELSWLIKLSVVCDENQIGQDMTDNIGVIYVENHTELSWPIKSGIDCDKKQIG